MPRKPEPSLEPVYIESAAAFRAWLARHGSRQDALLVGFHKVGSGVPSMSWSESVDEALCFGWIDGVRRRVDDARYCIRFTPRRAGSHWSRVNLAKVDALIAQGRMQAAGLAAWLARDPKRIARAAYEQDEAASLQPAEWERLQDHASAWAFFQQLAPGYRRTHLHWVCSAKREATRADRLRRCIEAWSQGINLWK